MEQESETKYFLLNIGVKNCMLLKQKQDVFI
jgi:hypothetical protein